MKTCQSRLLIHKETFPITAWAKFDPIQGIEKQIVKICLGFAEKSRKGLSS
jgi:hypothetical protein